MSIFLIRHGQTASNARRIVQTPETPLSPTGVEQAQRLSRRLAAAGIGRILSSDLVRAAMTAERLRAATAAPLVFDALLQERNYGEIRGTPYAELDVDLFAPDYAPPGGETWEQLHARVDRAWERIQAAAVETQGHLAVVTHGLVCHSLVSRRLEWTQPASEPALSDRPLVFENTALTIVDGPSPWRVRLFACTAHLNGPAGALRV